MVIEGGRATSVEFLADGRLQRARAAREVILCAGAAKSPQLLQLSGIGPADGLLALGIPVAVDLPGVGRNLRDHLRVPLVYRVARPRYSSPAGLVAAAWKYATVRRGLLTSNVADAAAILRLAPDAEVPDIRIVFAWRMYAERPETLVSFETGLIDPRSYGRVTLASSDPLSAPLIDPGYLTDPSDLPRLLAGLDRARVIASTRACQSAGIAEEVEPGPGSTVEHVRRRSLSSYHPVGTCRMGTDPLAVVDSQLRVRGVNTLRVVDASVMPTTITGNAQAAVIAIAERAADLLLPPPSPDLS